MLLRAIGPTLVQSGITNALPDPVMELHGPGAFATITNDNWRDDPAQEAAILATGIPPANNLEAAIDATLNPGAYTAIVRSTNNNTGVGLVEVYDFSQGVAAKLGNISTRAFVSTGNNIVIAGFILGSHSDERPDCGARYWPQPHGGGSAECAGRSDVGTARRQWSAPRFE